MTIASGRAILAAALAAVMAAMPAAAAKDARISVIPGGEQALLLDIRNTLQPMAQNDVTGYQAILGALAQLQDILERNLLVEQQNQAILLQNNQLLQSIAVSEQSASASQIMLVCMDADARRRAVFKGEEHREIGRAIWKGRGCDGMMESLAALEGN